MTGKNCKQTKKNKLTLISIYFMQKFHMITENKWNAAERTLDRITVNEPLKECS